MLLSLSTACLYHFPLSVTFRLAAQLGFDGLELVMGPEPWVRGADYIQGLSRSCRLPVLSVHQTLLPVGPSGTRSHRLVDAVEMALALNCHCVVMHGTWADRWAERQAQRWLDDLSFCQELLDGSHTRLALENHGIRAAGDAQSVLGRLVSVVDFCYRHDLDITLDTCHTGTSSQTLLEAYELSRQHLVNVHLSDLGRSGAGMADLRNGNLLPDHRIPGEGDLPLAGLITRLAEDGYEGRLTLEINPFALHAWTIEGAKMRLYRALAYIAGVTNGSG